MTPLSTAICRILYSFCKIRGEKVVVRFLNVETKHLEPLLHAIEDANRQADSQATDNTKDLWTWHERYVVLLWLSQLLFAPFDLSTISTGDLEDADRPQVPGFHWPSQVPGITLRVIPLALKYLASPGKERDGAKALLVRLAMRRDMQEVGILQALVHWALSTLQPKDDQPAESPYYYIGSLALLAGILRSSADTSIMNPYLTSIFYAVQAVSSETNEVFKAINGSALARKMMIKVVKSVVTLDLRNLQPSEEDTGIVESSIGYLLESLADNDTPVRFAASKALSVITLKLESDMASQVVEAVLDSLNRNVLWVKSQTPGSSARTRDLTAVDALEWHGLILTLSHLLYRRSPPPESLSDIINALIMGISFEKRGTAGGSVGTNVRDAACFGIWALARRYTTGELLQVPHRPSLGGSSVSIIQSLATELVVAASLDSAGNIRRGSSAALQELIGRHPDTVDEGIAVVQVVDYHAVALRSRAIHEVALQATRLSIQYGLGIREALLGWRGVGDSDAAARRVAGASFGSLTQETGRATSSAYDHFIQTVNLLIDRIKLLQVRQVEERHGLLLSLCAVFDGLPELVNQTSTSIFTESLPVSKLICEVESIVRDGASTAYRKPELIAEAVAELVVSSYPLLLLQSTASKTTSATEHFRLEPHSGRSLTEDSLIPLLVDSTVSKTGQGNDVNQPPEIHKLISTLGEAIIPWLNRNENEVVDAAAKATTILLVFSSPAERPGIIQRWINVITDPKASRLKHGHGYFFALTQTYQVSIALSDDMEMPNNIVEALKARWKSDSEIETHVAILRSLEARYILRTRLPDLVPLLSEGLDNYTTNARGDVGSHVRLEAIKATWTVWESSRKQCDNTISREVLQLFPQVLRLAAEKLDRVRTQAQGALGLLLAPRYVPKCPNWFVWS